MLGKKSQLYIVLFVILSMILANTAVQIFGNQKFMHISQERLYDIYGETKVIAKSYNYTLKKWWNKSWKLKIPISALTFEDINGRYNITLKVNITRLYSLYGNICSDCDINCFCSSIRIVKNNAEVPISVNCTGDIAYVNTTVEFVNGRFDGWLYICNPSASIVLSNITESDLSYYSEVFYLNGVPYEEFTSIDNKIFNYFMQRQYKFMVLYNVLEIFIKDKDKYIRIRENITG